MPDIDLTTRVTFTTVGGEQVQRVLDGITRSSLKGMQMREDAEKRFTELFMVEEKKRTAFAFTQLQTQEADAMRSLRRLTAARIRSERNITREMEANTKSQRRLAEDMASTQLRRSVILTSQQASTNTHQTTQATPPTSAPTLTPSVISPTDRLQQHTAFTQTLSQLARRLHLSQEQETALSAQIHDIAVQTGLNRQAFTDSIAVALRHGDATPYTSPATMSTLGAMAPTLGATVSELTETAATLTNLLHTSPNQLQSLLLFISQVQSAGAFDPINNPQQLANTATELARQTASDPDHERPALQIAKELAATAQALMNAGVSSTDAAQQAEELFRRVASAEGRSRLASNNFDLYDDDGQFIGVPLILSQLSTNPLGQSNEGRDFLFGANSPARLAVENLRPSFSFAELTNRLDPITELSIQQGLQGERLIETGQRRYLASDAAQLATQNAYGDREFNGKATRYSSFVNFFTAIPNGLSARIPELYSATEMGMRIVGLVGDTAGHVNNIHDSRNRWNERRLGNTADPTNISVAPDSRRRATNQLEDVYMSDQGAATLLGTTVEILESTRKELSAQTNIMRSRRPSINIGDQK